MNAIALILMLFTSVSAYCDFDEVLKQSSQEHLRATLVGETEEHIQKRFLKESTSSQYFFGKAIIYLNTLSLFQSVNEFSQFKKIEIGAAQHPICMECEHISAVNFEIEATKEVYKKYKLPFQGTVGMFHKVPMDESEYSTFVSKNIFFADYFFASYEKEIIASLEKLSQILTVNGIAYLLNSRDLDLESTDSEYLQKEFSRLAHLAQDCDFKVEGIASEFALGLKLTKLK